MAWPTVSDLGTYLQRTLTSGETAAATLILGLSQAEIKRAAHQTFDLVTNDVAALRGNWGAILTLPERPAGAVSAVSINGFSLVADVDYWASGQRILRGARPAGMCDGPRMRDWGGPNMYVTVTYTHGFSTLPPDVVDICLKASARALDAGDYGVVSETVGKTSFTYQDVSVSLTASEIKQLEDDYGIGWQ